MSADAPDIAHSSFEARMAFVIELAGHLHRYGTTSQRLEGAINAVAGKLGLHCEPWSNPTGLILAFRDKAAGGHDDVTRVIRLALGDTDLGRLVEADQIAEHVLAGKLDITAGHQALTALQRRRVRHRDRVWQTLGFGLAAAAVGGLLRLPWLDIATAGITGLLIGLLLDILPDTARAREAGDALAGMLAATVATLVASLIGPLNLNTVIIISVVVLLPGMMLTNAVNELTSQHLVSGTARFAGAVTVLVKLTVGIAVALTLLSMLGLTPQIRAARPQPQLVENCSIVLAAFAFAVVFRARWRDYPVVMLAASAGYLLSKVGTQWGGNNAGVLLSALCMTAAGNAYSRWFNRPGALVRMPGIIMLVPGSIGLRGVLNMVQQQDVAAGQASLTSLMNILFALVAGLLLGNLLLPTRRNL